MMMKHSNPAMMGGLTGSLSDAILALVSGALETLMTWQTRSDYRADLAELDDRMLSDMGISRQQVENEAHKPFWRA